MEVLKQIQREMSARKAGGWERVQWSLSPTGSRIKLARARVLGMPGNRFTASFAQITFLIRSNQKFVVYNSKGHRIAGSEDKELSVEECWVFERLIQKDSLTSRWRVAARLSLPKTQP